MAEPRRTITADPGDLKGVRILVVEARFYDDIAEELLKGATAVLDAAGAVYDRLTVPGSLEIPPAITIALDAAERAGKPYEGAVALGCVIRGDTIHFEIVSFESSRGLMEISRTRGVPIGNAPSFPPIGIDAIYVTDGQAVYGVTVAATGMLKLWRTLPQVTPLWALN